MSITLVVNVTWVVQYESWTQILPLLDFDEVESIKIRPGYCIIVTKD